MLKRLKKPIPNATHFFPNLGKIKDLSKLFNRLDDFIIVFNPDKKIFFANKILLNTLGSQSPKCRGFYAFLVFLLTF